MEVGDQAYLYLKSKGNKKLVGGIPYRLLELNKLKWFWKNLGLNRHDLDELHPKWIDEAFSVGVAIDRADAENIAGMNPNVATPVSAKTMKGPKQVKKLL